MWRVVHLHQRGAVATPYKLPAEGADHLVADGELRILRGHHFAGTAADHDVAEVDRGGVGLGVVHAAAHVGVEREPVVLHQHLVVARLRDLGFLEAEVAFLDPGRGAAGEDDALVLFHFVFLAGAGLKVGAGDTAILCLIFQPAQLESAE
jgi:hypothetical protein